MRTVRAAAIQARAEEVGSEKGFEHRVLRLTQQAVEDFGAELLVFPEDLCLWLVEWNEHPRALDLQAGLMLLARVALRETDPAVSGLPAERRFSVDDARELDQLFGWICRHLSIPDFGDYLAQPRFVETYRRAFALAAEQYRVPIVAGSAYERCGDGIYNVCTVFDYDGSIAGQVRKQRLVELEKSFGIREGWEGGWNVEVVHTRDYRIGACVCYDLNFPAFARELARQGAQILCAGSTGLRPFQGYPYSAEHDAPQIQRARETGLAVVRAYHCGQLAPGIYMDGLSNIAIPDSSSDTGVRLVPWQLPPPEERSRERIIVANVPLPD